MLKKHKCLSFLMWLFPLSFFTYQFILRLWPGLMMQTIMEQFSIDASHFGLLAALYYYGYAGMQITVANLLMVGSLEGFGMLFGGPLLAFLSKKLGNYRVIALAVLVWE